MHSSRRFCFIMDNMTEISDAKQHVPDQSQLVLPSVQRAVEDISSAYFGDHSLDAIYGAGCTERPDIALVFINPTHRNISTAKTWRGLKAPWIGCANIWQLLADAGLISAALNYRIQQRGTNWSEEFATEVYQSLQQDKLYITNIVKWAGLDARLPERAKIDIYTPILLEELEQVRPRLTILFGQLTYQAVMRAYGIRTGKFSDLNETYLRHQRLASIDTPAGSMIPCYFPVGQGIKNRAKAVEVLGLAADSVSRP